MPEPCSTMLTCVEEVVRIHQGCETFLRLYARALLDGVNLYGRGQENPPRIDHLTKLKQTEMECEYLKRCFGSLTEENRRLQREVEELRALMVAPPTVLSPLLLRLPPLWRSRASLEPKTLDLTNR
ncbi:Homeobox-leucine zipper protein HOX3 [Dendrobium catenatum]|uniref:Homeobox-leucine zipper protein HOX3 n=1 Tax=Dendrobium catenatum TaxID=906689 RepID=A0A2I0WB20_9ASPA|nr:Homeobox-leucine zipper protein HOX3 [Dendrobium catenatum]